VPNLSQPAPYEHLNGLENKGYLPPKRATITSPTMSIFGTKLAFTYNPPTHRLALRPQGIVSTGPLPLISWSIKKRVPYPPQMTLCFLRCTLTQSPVFTMSTESVKVCLLPSAFTYCKRHLIRQNAAVYTITSNLLPLALHQNLQASLHVKTSLPLNIRTKKSLFCTDTPLPHHRRLSKLGPGH